eukprot:Platyproteum_vivax@DN5449_c0_g1_i1.p1
MGNQCEIEIQVPDTQVGLLIGKGGAIMNEIQQTNNVRLQFSQKGDVVPNTNNRKVQIMGSVACVHAAHVMILQHLLAERQMDVTQQYATHHPMAGHYGKF